MSREPWEQDAVCAQIGSSLFFDPNNAQHGRAKRICDSCPVLRQCWESLIPHEAGRGRSDLAGFRAGLSAEARWRKLNLICPGCRGQRDRTSQRYCSGCAHLDSDEW